MGAGGLFWQTPERVDFKWSGSSLPPTWWSGGAGGEGTGTSANVHVRTVRGIY